MSPAHRPPSADDGTNVRIPAALRAAFGLLGRLAPSLAAGIAERLFFTPPPARRSRGEALLREAEFFRVSVDGRDVAAWRWGRGPAVGLVHGWGGRAAQLTSFVPPLLARGFSVVALDAPGHGSSGRGLSSAPQFARALRRVAEANGGLHGVVAHSLGAAATALALRDGLRVARVVFLGAAADPPSWVLPFSARLGLPVDVVDRVRERSERRLGLRWRDLHVPTLAVEFEAPALVVHDRDDAEVPFEDAAAIAAAWPDAKLVETAGLGHNGLLRDPDVVALAAGFLSDGVVTACVCGRPALDDGGCEACRFERELFDRELRWARGAA
jgi:pimeloyl-ACP methyl ester carboxylesterase